jgi:hypothetical protein
MLLKNIDIEHGLINGTRGIIKEYIYDSEGRFLSVSIRLSEKMIKKLF